VRKFSHKKKVITLVAAGAIAVAGAGAAYAYWTATGAGTGTATEAAGSTPLVITNAVPTGLAPGGSVSVAGTITNTNVTTSEYVNTVSAVLSVDAGHATCAIADFSLAPVVVAFQIPKSGTKTFSASLVMADTAVNQDPCKGATITMTWSSN
jgi:hypothetical protein